jgi:type IV pilus biogenesis protein CpaD/CtpE
MKTPARFVLLLVLAAALTGCAGAPVGWGGTDEIVFEDKDTIKIQWDNLTTTEDAVRQKALAHCARTNRSVRIVDASSDASTLGLIRSRTWKCTN